MHPVQTAHLKMDTHVLRVVIHRKTEEKFETHMLTSSLSVSGLVKTLRSAQLVIKLSQKVRQYIPNISVASKEPNCYT